MWNNNWKKGEDYPSWGETDVYKKTIGGGYLIKDDMSGLPLFIANIFIIICVILLIIAKKKY